MPLVCFCQCRTVVDSSGTGGAHHRSRPPRRQAMPRAMWPAERSSNAVTNRISGWECAAMTKGALREPGEATTSRRPHACVFSEADAPRWSVVNMPQRYGAIQAIARRCPLGWIRSYRGSLSTPWPGRSPQRCRHRQTSESHAKTLHAPQVDVKRSLIAFDGSRETRVVPAVAGFVVGDEIKRLLPRRSSNRRSGVQSIQPKVLFLFRAKRDVGLQVLQ